VLPDDPTGIEEPHDILAAEEFAMPAGRPGSGAGVRRHSDAVRRIALAGAAGALVVRLLRRRG
jgi:hypothetical protein